MGSSFHHSIDVRFRDCDEFGHVNNAVYFTYLEEARWAFLRHLQDRSRDHALTDSDRVPKQPGTILAHAECDFRSEAKYGEVLDVLVKVSAVGRSSFSYEYEVIEKSTNRLVATGVLRRRSQTAGPHSQCITRCTRGNVAVIPQERN